MKHFYSYFLLLLSIMGFALPQQTQAQTTTEDIDFSFYLMIDDPTLCYVEDANYQRVELKAGENVFNVKLHATYSGGVFQYGYTDAINLYIEDSKQDNYRITACDVEVGGSKTPYSGFYNTTTSMYIGFDSEDMNGCVLYPTISNLNDLRTATATVTVDDASKVQLRCGNDGYSPVLEDGTNTIKFNPEGEATWRIGHVNYGSYLGGVTLNGNAVSESYGTYELTVADGDAVAINTQANTDPVNVSFTFSNDGEAALKNVYSYVNYQQQPIDNWKAGFTVDPHSQIILELDRDAYNVSVSMNGTAQSIYDNKLYLEIADNSVINVDAQKYASRDIKLTITDPAHVTVGYSQSVFYYDNELKDLVAGEQTVSIPEQNTYMHVAENTGYTIDKVTYTTSDGEKEATLDYYSSSYVIPLDEATAVTVVSHENEGWSISINVDHGDRVYYNEFDPETYENTEIYFPEGTTTLTFKESSKDLNILVKEGFGIASFEDVKTGKQIEENWGSYRLELTSENDGDAYNIITFDEEESRTGEMTVWIDDASKVRISYMPSYKQVSTELVNGDNIIKYNPETETSIRIAESNYGTLYKVLVNGTEVMPEYDQFVVQCSPDNKVEVFANFPDIDVPVSFAFTNEGTEDVLGVVKVNEEQQADAQKGFTVKMGSKLTFDLNTVDYNVTKVTLNGEELMDSYYSWTVVDEKMDFVITAEKWEMIPFTLNINDPQAVTVYKGYSCDNVKYNNLVEGENKLEVAVNTAKITIMPNSGATMNSVTKNGTEVSKGYSGYEIEIAECDVITIDAKAAKRTAKATVWVDDASKAEYGCGMNRADESPYDDMDGVLNTGENIVMFDPEVDNPFEMAFYSAVLESGDVKVFINDSEDSLVPDVSNHFSNIVLKDGDYVKVYLGEVPSAIQTITSNVNSDAIYNIQGVKVQNTKNLPAGIYIKNGKKIVIK